MEEQKVEVKKSKMSPVLMVGIGCVVIIVILSVVISLLGGFIAKKVGVSMFESALESKTGVKANIEDLENGKMTFTDPKTGQTVNIGTGELPTNFPKDFPIYPGSKVVSAVAGGGNEEGFFVNFSTSDSSENVTQYYKDSFEKNGWTIDTVNEYGALTTIVVNNATLEGSVSVNKDESSKETGIVVTLGQKAE